MGLFATKEKKEIGVLKEDLVKAKRDIKDLAKKLKEAKASIEIKEIVKEKIVVKEVKVEVPIVKEVIVEKEIPTKVEMIDLDITAVNVYFLVNGSKLCIERAKLLKAIQRRSNIKIQ